MTHNRTTIGAFILTSAAIAIGTYCASLEPSAQGGGGSGSGSGGSLVAGQDVIVGAIPNISKYGSVVVGGQTIMAYALGTTSCNIGTAQLEWFASPDNRHPFIPQNFYRIKDGRLEHIGASWGKHGFTALQQSLCGTCQASPTGTYLGIGCSDPYSSGLNGSQSGLGCRSEVNAATGVFPGTINAGMPSAAATIGRRLQVNANDLNPTLNAGAIWIAEAQYIHSGDSTAGNDNNNSSWRPMTIGALSSGAYTITLGGSTNMQKNVIEAWKTYVPTVTVTNIDVPSDGRLILGHDTKDNGNGTWHYEYSILNLNSHRSGNSFSVPVPAGVTITNAGFRDIDYHSGDPYSPTDWTISTSGGAITWTGGNYATSANSNALRFATTYTFRFDASTAPTATNATLGLFRPGTPTSMTVATAGPSALPSNPADINGDGLVNALDVTEVLSQWGSTGTADINNDGIVNGMDLGVILAAWS